MQDMLLGQHITGVAIRPQHCITSCPHAPLLRLVLVSGTYAEYALAHEDSVLPIPEGWSFNEAAAVPLAAMTAWQVGTNSITL
jgi:NADPH:quinone reductase-like Zn-dependent oxidoreductase